MVKCSYTSLALSTVLGSQWLLEVADSTVLELYKEYVLVFIHALSISVTFLARRVLNVLCQVLFTRLSKVVIWIQVRIPSASSGRFSLWFFIRKSLEVILEVRKRMIHRLNISIV
jgi:hypothetical protein